MESVVLTPCVPLPKKSRCAYCDRAAPHLRCSRCKILFYCSRAHQAAHRGAHKQACNFVGAMHEDLAMVEKDLRSQPGHLPPDPQRCLWEAARGDFWRYDETHVYMGLRVDTINAISDMRPESRASLQTQLDFVMGSLHLAHADVNWSYPGIRIKFPQLTTRLGQDQECFDFIKWWMTTGRDPDYKWGQEPERYLDIHGVDVFGRWPTCLREYPTYALFVTLIKIRMLLDLYELQKVFYAVGGRLPPEILDQIRACVPQTAVIAANHGCMFGSFRHLSERVRTLEQQISDLYDMVDHVDEYIWDALVTWTEGMLKSWENYGVGGPPVLIHVLTHAYKSWAETPAALEYIRKLDKQRHASRKRLTPNPFEDGVKSYCPCKGAHRVR